MRHPGQAGVQSGTKVCDGLTLYHDCPSSEIVLRHLPQVATSRVAPLGLSVETFHFGGRYLSFALTLPPDALRDLTLDHLLTVEVRLSVSPPCEVYVRLNLRHGPNTAQVTRQAPFAAVEVRAEFDLRTIAFRPDRLSEIWVDLILERPEMTRCMIEDVVVSRRLRAIL
jgi:hypothetical protein